MGILGRLGDIAGEGRLVRVLAAPQPQPVRGFARLLDGRLMETENGQIVEGPVPEPGPYRSAERDIEPEAG